MEKRRLVLLITFLILGCNGWAALPTYKTAAQKGIDTTDKNESAIESSLPRRIYQKLSGRNSNFYKRILLSVSKKGMKTWMMYPEKSGGIPAWQKACAFIAGVAFNFFAVIAGYIFLKGKNRALIKWIWLGFALCFIIGLYFFIKFIQVLQGFGK